MLLSEETLKERRITAKAVFAWVQLIESPVGEDTRVVLYDNLNVLLIP